MRDLSFIGGTGNLLVVDDKMSFAALPTRQIADPSRFPIRSVMLSLLKGRDINTGFFGMVGAIGFGRNIWEYFLIKTLGYPQ